MKWFLLFVCLASPALAQNSVGSSNTSGSGGPLPANMPSVTAQKNVTVVYSKVTGQPLMIVIDAVNLSDQAFNPPNSTQVSIPPATYNTMTPAALDSFVTANTPVVSVAQ